MAVSLFAVPLEKVGFNTWNFVFSEKAIGDNCSLKVLEQPPEDCCFCCTGV
jgi:hypothetical protein